MIGKNRLLYKPPPQQDNSANFCKLYIVIAISFVFIAGEFVGGFISGSISVISDAFHLVTDLIGFAVSFFFIYYAQKEPTEKMSFGYHRMELLGALGNLFIIWFLAIFMIYEATDRIIHKQFVAEPLAMLIVGVAGLAINIVMYFVLHSGSHSHGLMSESCDHHHEVHDNDPNPSNCTTSFCNELLCDDTDCLKQINYSHCHTKNPQGDLEIHIHDSKRKISEDLDENKGEGGQSSMIALGKEKKTKSCKTGCQHDHEHQLAQNQTHDHIHDENDHKNQHKNDHDHEHEHDHQHQHDHENHKQQQEHQHSENCKHQTISPQTVEIELKTVNKDQKKPHSHEHGDNCKHQHKKNNKHQHSNEKQHKHSENCKHQHKNQSEKKHAHTNDHTHDHKHDHNHDHKHDHHDHDHHGNEHEHEQNHGQHQSLGMKAAVLHALSDVIQSIGLLISSLFIFFLGSNKGAHVTEWNDWHYLDPISTYIFSVIVIISTFPIVKNCYFIIMESTPSTEVARQIKREFEETPGVVDVHDLHIWNLRPGKNLIIAHVFAKDGAEREVLTKLTQICRRKKIFHSTLQVEQENWKNHEDYILCDHDIY